MLEEECTFHSGKSGLEATILFFQISFLFVGSPLIFNAFHSAWCKGVIWAELLSLKISPRPNFCTLAYDHI